MVFVFPCLSGRLLLLLLLLLKGPAAEATDTPRRLIVQPCDEDD
jgi:hypothetical protein